MKRKDKDITYMHMEYKNYLHLIQVKGVYNIIMTQAFMWTSPVSNTAIY